MIYLAQVPETPAGQKAFLHKAAWALLGLALGKKASRLADSLRFGPHGKPYLENGPHFSLSHTKGLVLCAVEEWNTGADGEYLRSFSPRLRERVFTPEEREEALSSSSPDRAFTTLWTLKESYMKLTGLGLAQGAETLRFRLEGGQPFLEGGQPFLEGGEAFFRTAVWEGYSISQCGEQPFAMEICSVDFHLLNLKEDPQ